MQKAEDAWNTRDPERVALAYTVDSKWRNRDEFFEGREAIVDFLRRKWSRELDYRLEKELWCYQVVLDRESSRRSHRSGVEEACATLILKGDAT